MQFDRHSKTSERRIADHSEFQLFIYFAHTSFHLSDQWGWDTERHALKLCCTTAENLKFIIIAEIKKYWGLPQLLPIKNCDDDKCVPCTSYSIIPMQLGRSFEKKKTNNQGNETIQVLYRYPLRKSSTYFEFAFLKDFALHNRRSLHCKLSPFHLSQMLSDSFIQWKLNGLFCFCGGFRFYML